MLRESVQHQQSRQSKTGDVQFERIQLPLIANNQG
jgi:hypothetical protein